MSVCNSRFTVKSKKNSKNMQYTQRHTSLFDRCLLLFRSICVLDGKMEKLPRNFHCWVEPFKIKFGWVSPVLEMRCTSAKNVCEFLLSRKRFNFSKKKRPCIWFVSRIFIFSSEKAINFPCVCFRIFLCIVWYTNISPPSLTLWLLFDYEINSDSSLNSGAALFFNVE